MKIMVFNDTSDFHDGCRAVMDYLHNDLKENGYVILESVKNGEFPQYSEKNFKDAKIKAEELCKKLLANLVIEEYRIIEKI